MMKRVPSKNTRILIILMGSIGDVVRGMSLVSHIKAHLQQCRITWLVEPVCAQLVLCHPQIDKVIVFNRSHHILALPGLYRALFVEQFDIVLDLQRHFKSGFFSFLSGGKRRIGFHRQNAKELNWIFNTEHIGYFNNEIPKINHYFKFTKYLGLPDPGRLDFGFSHLNLKTFSPTIHGMIRKPFIGVVMGSSWESKDWFFDGYYHLVKEILVDGRMNVVLIGDKSRTVMANALCEKIRQSEPDVDLTSHLTNLVGKTSLVELIGILKEASVGVGPDSGPGHLAAAVGTSFVSLFGPTSPKRVAPYGSEHLVVQANVNCAPCYKKRCPESEKRCMKEIRVETVLEKLFNALKMVGNQ